MTLKSAVAPQIPPALLVTAPARAIPVRRRSAPSKPAASSVSLHPAHAPAAHAPAAPKTAAGGAAKLDRRDRVVLEHLPLVKAIAVRVHENLPVHVDLDDL